MEITACPSLGRYISAIGRRCRSVWGHPHVYHGGVLVCPHCCPFSHCPYLKRPNSNHKQPRPWPLALQGFWTPPFLPLFWIYGATALLRSYLAARLHQYSAHRRWMIRLNAVFLSVTLSRPVVVTAVVVLVSEKPCSRSSHPLTDGASCVRVRDCRFPTRGRRIPISAGSCSGAAYGDPWRSTYSLPRCGSPSSRTLGLEKFPFDHRSRPRGRNDDFVYNHCLLTLGFYPCHRSTQCERDRVAE